MKADGQVHLYERFDDPEERGTILGFDKRFIALPIRSKGIGAIVSDGTGGVTTYNLRKQIKVTKKAEKEKAASSTLSESELE